MATNRLRTAPAGELSAEVFARLDDLAVPAEFETGAVVLHDGAPVPFLGIVDRGRIALRLHVPGRGRVTIVTIEPGELVGWSAVVPPFRATAEAVAVEPTRLVTYDGPALRQRLETDPDLAAALLPAILESVSERLTTSWQQLLDLFGDRPVDPW